MKRFVDEFNIHDYDVMINVVKGLEAAGYQVEMYEKRDSFDIERNRHNSYERLFTLKVFMEATV